MHTVFAQNAQIHEKHRWCPKDHVMHTVFAQKNARFHEKHRWCPKDHVMHTDFAHKSTNS